VARLSLKSTIGGFFFIVFFIGFYRFWGLRGAPSDGKRFVEVNGVNELRGTFRI